MEELERQDMIKGTLREIEILKGRRKKLYQEGWKINYNSVTGQKQSEKLEKDIEDVNNEIAVAYEDLGKLRYEKLINVTFTAELQGDFRLQIPSPLRRKLDLMRGDVLELTIRRKL